MNLRYADDIVVFAQSQAELTDLFQELNQMAKEIRPEMNICQIKFTKKRNTDTNAIIIEGQHYKKLIFITVGQEIALGKQKQELEINNKIRQSWGVYGKIKYALKTNIPIKLKTRIYDECILPVTTYGSEAWFLAQRIMNKLKKYATLSGAGHVARNPTNWSPKINRWPPWGERMSTGRPQQRWYDDIKRTAGINWYQVAQDRETCRRMGEAYTQWVKNGLRRTWGNGVNHGDF
ncbi:hypothetical protein HUJ04_011244 [Dendroctonus ponderosae]|nr:hypothetical protein HUJ04_011244 [Dendroctonus ponderosae]